MKIIRLFFFTTLFVAFLMCSKNHTGVLDQETNLVLDSRGNTVEKDSADSTGATATITPPDVFKEDITATEMPQDKAETDSAGGIGATIGDRPVVPVEPIIVPQDKEQPDTTAPCDSIPNDSIPNGSIPNDSIPKK